MSNFVPLGEIISPSKVERAGNLDLPVLSMTRHRGLVPQRNVFDKKIASRDLSKYKVVRPNQLVVGIHIDEGALGVSGENQTGIVSPAYTLWDLQSKEQINSEYLNRFVRSTRAVCYFSSKYRQTAERRGKISRDDFLALPVPLPSLEEQRRIAAILDKADAIGQKCQHALTLADDFLSSTFLEMFGDPVANPKSFDRAYVEDLCQVISDCLHKTPKHFDDPSPYPSVRSSELQNGFIDLSSAKYVTEEEYIERIQRHTPVPGDIIYCREGARYGNVGLIEEGMTVCLGQRTMLFQAKEGVVTSEYLWATLCSKGLYHQAERKAGGAASPHVNIRDIRKFDCVLPPYELQLKFSSICQNVLRQRKKLVGQINEAEALKKSLAQKAFRGEL